MTKMLTPECHIVLPMQLIKVKLLLLLKGDLILILPFISGHLGQLVNTGPKKHVLLLDSQVSDNDKENAATNPVNNVKIFLLFNGDFILIVAFVFGHLGQFNTGPKKHVSSSPYPGISLS